MYEISRELLNRLHQIHREDLSVWSLAQTSLNVKVNRDKNGIFRPIRHSVCILFGRTSLALVLEFNFTANMPLPVASNA